MEGRRLVAQDPTGVRVYSGAVHPVARRLIVSCVALGVLAASGARAQPATDEARDAFRAGSVAAQEERWADSERAFRRSFELSGAMSALFNRAVALRALGRHVEARDSFDRVLESSGALDPAIRAQAVQLRTESAGRVATIELAGLGPPHPELRVRVDGARREDEGERPLTLELDEGTHAVAVERAGFTPFRWRGALGAGERRALEVTLTEEVLAAPPEGGSVAEEPWLWILLGALVLGGAAALTTGLMLDAQLGGDSRIVIEL